jgi:hypothetical protein
VKQSLNGSTNFCSATALFNSLLVVAFTLFGATAPAHGALYSNAGVIAVEGNNTDIYDTEDTGTDFASAIDIATGYSGTAIAQTEYRSNSITVTVGKTTESGFSTGGATSRWSDGLFFSGGTLGDTFDITFILEITGSATDDAVASFSFEFDTEDEYEGAENTGDVYRGATTVSDEIMFTVEATYNDSVAETWDPIYIESELSGNASVGRNDTGTASLNFGNTALLTEVILPTGVVMTSLSGTDYSAPLVSPVPVPAAVWLFGTALIGLLGFGKRRNNEIS